MKKYTIVLEVTVPNRTSIKDVKHDIRFAVDRPAMQVNQIIGMKIQPAKNKE